MLFPVIYFEISRGRGGGSTLDPRLQFWVLVGGYICVLLERWWGWGTGGLEIENGNGWTAEYGGMQYLVCNIWYYVARKKTWRGSKQYCIYAIWKKMCMLKRGLQACLLKKNSGVGGGGVQAAISNKAKSYLSQNYNKKSISSFVFRQLYIIKHIC